MIRGAEVDRKLVDGARACSGKHGVDRARSRGALRQQLRLLRADGELGGDAACIARVFALAYAQAFRSGVHCDERRAGVVRISGGDSDGTPAERRIGALFARGEEAIAVKVHGLHRPISVPIGRARRFRACVGWSLQCRSGTNPVEASPPAPRTRRARRALP